VAWSREHGRGDGQLGLVGQQAGVTVTVMAFDITGDRIKHIWAVLSSAKLRPWTR
jgi:RNA polymerase sigma-70 factor (ECF subfamily)